MALLRLAQGRGDGRNGAICRVLDEARDRRARSNSSDQPWKSCSRGGLEAERDRATEELQTIASVLRTP